MNHSEPAKVKLITGDAEVFNDIGNDAAWHISRVPREGDDSLRAKRIGIMTMTSGVAQVNAANLFQPPFQSAAIEGGVLAHSSSREHKLVSERRRNRASCLEQRLEMRFGRLLKTQDGFTSVTPMRVAARKQVGFGNPNPVFVLARLNLRDRNDHNLSTINIAGCGVNASRRLSLTPCFSGVGLPRSSWETVSTVFCHSMIPLSQHFKFSITPSLQFFKL